jgi:hypothetical protein
MRILAACTLFWASTAANAQASIYDFEGLALRNLSGQDGWLSQPAMGEIVVRVDDSPVNGTQVARPDVGVASGAMALLTRVNDGAFQFDPFLGDHAVIQFEADGEAIATFGLGRDLDGDRLLSRTNGEAGPLFGIVRDPEQGIAQFAIQPADQPVADLATTSVVSALTAADSSNEPGDWYRLQLRIDLAANAGAGAGSLYFMNLSEGDAAFRPVPGLQGVPLALDALDPAAGPGAWNAMWLAMQFSGNQNVPSLDNLDPSVAQAALVAAVLPASRAVQEDTIATAFATVINTSQVTALGCSVALPPLPPGVEAELDYQTTDPDTNQLVGEDNTPADVPPGGLQTFVFAIEPETAFASTDIALVFDCANSAPAPTIAGVNTFRLTSTVGPTSDIVAVAATVDNDGIVKIPGLSGTGVFAVATTNVGIGANVTASVDSGDGNDVADLALCRTDAAGQCTTPIGQFVTGFLPADGTASFGVFVSGRGEAIPLDAANNRVFVRFTDEVGIEVGSTSVAVQTQ